MFWGHEQRDVIPAIRLQIVEGTERKTDCRRVKNEPIAKCVLKLKLTFCFGINNQFHLE